MQTPWLRLQRQSLWGSTARPIRAGLEDFSPYDKRFSLEELDGVVLIDDSYNANPASVEAALKTVLDIKGGSRAIAILGDMLELGPDTAAAHHARGSACGGVRGAALRAGPACRGPLPRGLSKGASPLPRYSSRGSHEEVLADLAGHLGREEYVLVKGSRGMRMESHRRRHTACPTPETETRGGDLMLYHLFYPLSPSVKLFNVFKYLTFRTIYAMITALIVSFIIGPWVIRKLESLQARQVIRTDGPESHLKKQGTPTMGGVLILAAIIVPTLLWADLSNLYIWATLFIIVGYGLIGFVDDYKKVVEKNPKGLSPRQKMFWQLLLSGGGRDFSLQPARFLQRALLSACSSGSTPTSGSSISRS